LTTDFDSLTRRSDAAIPMIDAGDAAVAAADFSIGVNPTMVVVSPMAPASVDVTVLRMKGFMGAINVSANPPLGIQANMPIITPDMTSVKLNLSAMPGVVPGDYIVTVVGQYATEVSSAPLAVHVPGVLASLPATIDFKVPNVSRIRVKAWGGGGAGGNGYTASNVDTGGAGGGGGFVQLDLDVTPGETLHVDVATGGKVGGGGGGGGGYSALSRQGMMVLQAAGGGGGGQVGNPSQSGGIGGGGGGMSGQTSPGGLGGQGGSQSAGGLGANPGGPNQGGNGGVSNPNLNTAGQPGGGAGSQGGGGGGGKFGGGGGKRDNTYSNGGGGGGGSSWCPNGMNINGSGASAANGGDPNYVMGVGAGGVGVDAQMGTSPSNGGNGLVVIIVP
jgi:hypothetical protein